MAFSGTIARLFSKLGHRKPRAARRKARLVWLEGLEERVVMSSTPTGYMIQGHLGSYQVPRNGASSFTAASITAGTLPSGLSLSNAGVISGTPAAGTEGNYSLTVNVTPSGGSALDEPLILTVLPDKFVNPNYSVGDGFGTNTLVLTNGNLVVTAPYDDAGGTDAGAVYLFNGYTGALISTLTGSNNNDYVGLAGISALSNGNYVVRSPYWDNGTVADAGAVTWGSGTTGVSGVISSSNSLVGFAASDNVGNGKVTVLSNGNYVVTSGSWDNGTVADAGAVTWGSGTAGITGVVTSSNSLVGSATNGKVGSFVTPLTNGNYVVSSPFWSSGKGAVTWGSGTAGVTGVVSSDNSLVGSTALDMVGSAGFATVSTGITVLTNGNYVVGSPHWSNDTVSEAGAATWGSGTAGVTGVVSSINSLVGSTRSDWIGEGITALTKDGNYVVNNPNWDNGTVTDAGAATWGSGSAGVKGVVSSINSLVGSRANDLVGGEITALTNGNYVVISPSCSNGTVLDAGAVTWGSGSAGVKGVVSPTNSLVGSTANDAVGSGNSKLDINLKHVAGVTALTNGDYVVSSPNWSSGMGAATWGSGTAGISGLVSSTNSLIGSTSSTSGKNDGDNVGYFITALSNGNYVVRSPYWSTGMGAVTWGSSTAGVKGVVSSDNSLVGSRGADLFGYFVRALTNADGNYVVYGKTAVAWGSGTTGVTGFVSSTNSLVVSNGYVYALTNGNYVVASTSAVTWGSGTSGVTGVVSSSNSLIVSGSVTALTNGNYVVNSQSAVTWGSGTSGVTGVVSPTNSLVLGGNGIFQNIYALSNGNYLVQSNNWSNGTVTNAGSVTFGNGTSGTSGTVSGLNSLIGPFVYFYPIINTVTNSYLMPMQSPAVLAYSTISLEIPPAIVQQPADTGVNTGSAATFTAVASGTPAPTVQWYKSTDGGNSWTAIPGATSATYTTPNTTSADDLSQYRAVFDNGIGTAATTQAAVLNVGQIPVVSTNPVNQIVSLGGTVSFTAAGTGSPAPTVQWQFSSNGGSSWTNITGGTANTYSFTPGYTDDHTLYRAVYSNRIGVTPSTPANLIVKFAPVIATQPASTTVLENTTATFTPVVASDPPANVQWQVSTNSGGIWSDISGATAASYTTPVNSATNNGYQYRATYTNWLGTATTNPATLTVNYLNITTQPSNATIAFAQLGTASATFTAAVNANPSATVQWYKSTDYGTIWTDIPGATSTSYSYKPGSVYESGTLYRAVFTTSAQTVTTSAAILKIPCVTNTNDTGTGSLRAAIGTANGANRAMTIFFDETVFNAAKTITLASELPALSKDVIIQGPTANKVTISGGGNSSLYRFITVNSGINAQISNLTFTNFHLYTYFYIYNYAGAVINNNGNLTVSGCTFTNNTNASTLGGGAISSPGSSSSLTVTGSTFTSNTGYYGGAISCLGSLTVSSSTFSSNSATINNDVSGGAIYVAAASAAVGATSISNSTFNSNTAAGTGGAIGWEGSSQGTITNCTITGNTASGGWQLLFSQNGSGGGIFYAGAGLSIISAARSLAIWPSSRAVPRVAV